MHALQSTEEPLRLSDVFREKTLFIIGATGFVGKVYLYLLLRRHIDVQKIYCLIRPKPGKDANERLRTEVMTSPTFDPLREAMGHDAFEWIVGSKLEAIEGDIGMHHMGIPPERFEQLKDEVHVMVNSSGLVDFNPPLEEALFVNAIGIRNVVDVAESWNAPLLHVSTCYVAGNRSGTVMEDPHVLGFFPNRDSMEGVTFDPQRELDEGLHLARMVREEAQHQEQISAFTHEARKKLIEAERNPSDPVALEKEVTRIKDKWIARRLMEYGVKRAEFYGWTNIYTYSKSLGEQVVARAKVPFTIVRPSIVESSIRFPFPGWNEGFNTTAPLSFVAIKGHVSYPVGSHVNLDIIPVDLVASGMLTVTGALMVNRHKEVYHLASADLNPCSMNRVVELVGLWKRKHYLNRGHGNPILNGLYGRVEARPVPHEHYNRFSAPMFSKLAGLVMDAAKAIGGGQKRGIAGVATVVGEQAKAFQKNANNVSRMMDIFYPFTIRNNYRFRCDNMRELFASLSPEDQAALPWDPDQIDWLHYWLDIHSVGLEKWVFPKIKDQLNRKPLPNIYTYEDLLELLDAATINHTEDVAMRMLYANGAEEVFSYEQVRERAGWVASFLVQHGVGKGDRVLLVSENRPQWGMAYFGILQAGATCVPVDSKATAREIGNLARASTAKAVLVSDKIWQSSEDSLMSSVSEPAALYPFGRIFRQPAPEKQVALTRVEDRDQLACLLFTSGTTGTPKGVMLSHQNFTALVSSMAKVFRLSRKDRMLSVLPLHHTFEFSTGLLLPLSRGSQVIYLEEVNADMLQAAFKRHKITAMVGVPALWELLYRKIKGRVSERGAAVEGLFMGMQTLNRFLRDRFGINMGRLLFGQIYSTFGGRIRYLISGAAALPAEVQKSFDAFGLDLYEGYGLSEAAPVLSVNRPGKRPVAGSVGLPLPGIEVQIHNPDENGVGEIIARGPNVMQGYLNEPGMTADVLKDGWLFTGDLGKLDSAGRIFIMGRRKEVIVDASGKNVYPDEIEELYAGSSFVKELCVVGVPDGRGSEQVACLVVPETEGAAQGLSDADVRTRIEEHFRAISLTLPYHQRVKVLRFRDQLLPRTTTRKIKRRDVVKLLEAMLKGEEAAANAGKSGTSILSEAWLVDVISRVTGRKVESIQPSTRFVDDLGLDSLVANELLAALEPRSGGSLEIQDLLDAHTIEGLAQRLRDRAPTHVVRPVQSRRPARLADRPWEIDLSRLHELSVPEPVRSGTKAVLRQLQRTLYEDAFDVVVKGRAFIPAHRNVLVICNHSSHLDMGLVKTALGDYGEDLITLAAADYFFAEGPRRFYFENFTNAVPLDRLNPTRESIRRAQQLLEEGHNLLLFPEGTRSKSGEIQTFKRGVGMMALKFQVDVLPIYLKGAYDAMPKGAFFPKKRRLEVRIGAPVRYTELEKLTRELPVLQAQGLVAQVLQKAVECLRDGKLFDLKAAASDGPSRSPLEVLFDDLKKRFDKERVEQPITFYFTLGPEEGDKWTVQATSTEVEIFKGKPKTSADCVLKTSISMFTRIVREGYVPSVPEFMNGTVKTNDPSKLQQFQAIFNL
ncbi:MAG: AMP-binding protein [Myxococcota bacterium]